MSDFGFFLTERILVGAQTTVLLFVGCAIAGNLLALPVAFARMSGNRALRYPATVFILVFRGTPLLIQLYIFYFGFGQVLAAIPSLRYGMFWPIFRNAETYAFFTLTLNTAAYCSEIWRGSIGAVARGQGEAGRALGLSEAQIMRLVVLPQALRIGLPAIGGQNILLLKGTALTATITIFELMGAANFVRAQTFRVYEPLLAAAFAYFLLALVVTAGFGYIEKRLTQQQR